MWCSHVLLNNFNSQNKKKIIILLRWSNAKYSLKNWICINLWHIILIYNCYTVNCKGARYSYVKKPSNCILLTSKSARHYYIFNVLATHSLLSLRFSQNDNILFLHCKNAYCQGLVIGIFFTSCHAFVWYYKTRFWAQLILLLTTVLHETWTY